MTRISQTRRGATVAAKDESRRGHVPSLGFFELIAHLEPGPAMDEGVAQPVRPERAHDGTPRVEAGPTGPRDANQLDRGRELGAGRVAFASGQEPKPKKRAEGRVPAPTFGASLDWPGPGRELSGSTELAAGDSDPQDQPRAFDQSSHGVMVPTGKEPMAMVPDQGPTPRKKGLVAVGGASRQGARRSRSRSPAPSAPVDAPSAPVGEKPLPAPRVHVAADGSARSDGSRTLAPAAPVDAPSAPVGEKPPPAPRVHVAADGAGRSDGSRTLAQAGGARVVRAPIENHASKPNASRQAGRVATRSRGRGVGTAGQEGPGVQSSEGTETPPGHRGEALDESMAPRPAERRADVEPEDVTPRGSVGERSVAGSALGHGTRSGRHIDSAGADAAALHGPTSGFVGARWPSQQAASHGPLASGPTNLQDQVVSGLRAAMGSRGTWVVLRLEPEDLGEVKIRIHMTSQGKLHVTMDAAREETAVMLQRHAQELTASLGSAAARDAEVYVSHQGGGAAGWRGGRGGRGSPRGDHHDPGEVEVTHRKARRRSRLRPMAGLHVEV